MNLLKRLTLKTRQASVMTANVHQQKAQANLHGFYQLWQDGGQICM